MAVDRQQALEYYKAGAECHDARNFETAVVCYKLAIKSDPKYEPPYNDLSAALSNLGRFEEAMPFAERAYRYRPNHPPVLANLLRCLYELRRFAEARQYLDAAECRGVDPLNGFPINFVWMNAQIYLFTNEFEKALPLFEAVLAELPENHFGLLGAAMCEYYFGRLERSLVFLKRAQEIASECGVTCFRMALCYQRCGLESMAIKYCRMALERDRDIDLGHLAVLVS